MTEGLHTAHRVHPYVLTSIGRHLPEIKESYSNLNLASIPNISYSLTSSWWQIVVEITAMFSDGQSSFVSAQEGIGFPHVHSRAFAAHAGIASVRHLGSPGPLGTTSAHGETVVSLPLVPLGGPA